MIYFLSGKHFAKQIVNLSIKNVFEEKEGTFVLEVFVAMQRVRLLKNKKFVIKESLF